MYAKRGHMNWILADPWFFFVLLFVKVPRTILLNRPLDNKNNPLEFASNYIAYLCCAVAVCFVCF